MVFGQVGVEDVARDAGDAASVDGDDAVGSDKGGAAWAAVDDAGAGGGDEGGAAHGRVSGEGGVGAGVRRLDADGSRGVEVEAPLRDVEVVGAHVGEVSAAVFLVAAPDRVVVVDASG